MRLGRGKSHGAEKNMTRKTDGWQSRLGEYLSETSQTPFAYGVSDCALFSAGAVLAMTGVDLAAEWRGRYKTMRGGLRVLRASGHANHVALAAATFPATDLPTGGDLAVIETEHGPALGVLQGALIYALRETGIGLLPISAATLFFEV